MDAITQPNVYIENVCSVVIRLKIIGVDHPHYIEATNNIMPTIPLNICMGKISKENDWRSKI